MSLSDSNKNSDIEVLRAVAVLFVVVHHLGFLFVWDGAWQKLFAVTTFWGGVDLFFCISGFVIASSLLRETREVPFVDFAIPFWIKRIWRIWPAAILWLLIAILASKFFNLSGAFGVFKANVEDGVAAVMQVANFHFLNCWFYKQGLCGNEGIYWSLSLEEQFYFVFPFVLFFLPRKWLYAGLVMVILLQCFLDRPMDSPLWVTRTDAICYGVLIALIGETSWKQKLFPHFLKSKGTAITFSLVLIVLLAAIPTHDMVWFDTGLLALVCAVLVFVASFDAKLILPISVLGAVLAWAGSRSFAIYLTHNFSFWLTHEIVYRLYPGVQFDESYTLRFAIVGFGFIVLLSECTYRLVERPFRDKGREIARRYRAGAAANAPAPNAKPEPPAAPPAPSTAPIAVPLATLPLDLAHAVGFADVNAQRVLSGMTLEIERPAPADADLLVAHESQRRRAKPPR
jgi:peptidoglycan/LPS O-acetylase OafA/YrhL